MSWSTSDDSIRLEVCLEARLEVDPTGRNSTKSLDELAQFGLKLNNQTLNRDTLLAR